MGANQSSDGGGHDSQRGSGDLKTCYYELLGVDRQATDEEIKKAYRKKALELHPDRNFGNVDETTKLFSEIQSAYEVLSDPQERSWYDSHRSTILRGEGEAPGDHYEYNVRITTSEDLMRMFARFTGQLDYSDSSGGFFSVLRDTFATLAKEEDVACEWEGPECVDYPGFGHADNNYEEVVRPFYAAWNGFATKKTFSWMDVYRTTDAPDRRVRRMMEKENKRFRDEGIRDFNDTVRQLVAFVRKRDPRYKPNTQTDAERQRIIRDAATAQAARSRAANRAKLAETQKVADWAKESEVINEDEQGLDDEKLEEEFECVVCRKVFKSEKQYDAHEKSKKHIKAVQRLQKDMRSEAEALDLSNDRSSATSTPANGDALYGSGLSQQKEEEATIPKHIGFSEQETESVAPDEIKAKSDTQDFINDLSASPGHSAISAPSTDDEYASREKIEERIVGVGKADSRDEGEHSSVFEKLTHTLDEADLNGDTDPVHSPKPGKAKEKRAKKAAQKAAADSLSAEFKCATCNAGFPSKTRLYSHIQDFGHAKPVLKPAKAGKGKNR